MRPPRLLLAVLFAGSLAAPAFAETVEGGELNPEELTIDFVKKRIRQGAPSDPIACMHGYFATKVGDHKTAVEIFDRCVKDHNLAAMTMRSQMHDNGQGGPENPEAAADLDRAVAEAGHPVGQFNYGLDLMRGRGVTRDAAAGKAWVDKAAAQGLDSAQRLVSAGYDLEEVTPDADEWKYAPRF